MTPKRLYFLLIGLIGLLLVGLLAGTYGTNSLLISQAGKLTNLKAKNLALSQEQLGLSKAKEEVKKYSSLEQITQAIVPEDKDQALTVREIVNLANQFGVNLASINFPESSLGNTTAVSTTGVAPAGASSSESAANAKLNNLSQLTAVPKIPGVYELPITVAGDPNKPVTYSAFISFLTGLEHNRRTAQVSTISLAPSTTNPELLTFTLTLNEYIKP
jgi:hypothetical protein